MINSGNIFWLSWMDLLQWGFLLLRGIVRHACSMRIVGKIQFIDSTASSDQLKIKMIVMTTPGLIKIRDLFFW